MLFGLFDKPARASILNIKSSTGYSGCIKFLQTGQRYETLENKNKNGKIQIFILFILICIIFFLLLINFTNKYFAFKPFSASNPIGPLSDDRSYKSDLKNGMGNNHIKAYLLVVQVFIKGPSIFNNLKH